MTSREPLHLLLDPAAAAARAESAGLSAGAAGDAGALLARCAAALRDAGVDPARPVCAHFVPGRVEVLGKHTDYLGGRSLLAAVERGFCIVAAAREDDRVRVLDAGAGEAREFPLSPELATAPGDWANYPMTVARRLARNFPGAHPGADLALASNLPPASGMSSSSALIVATWLALATLLRLDERAEYRAEIRAREDLADYLASVENGSDYGALRGDRGVGTQGGSEDHTAILCARPGALVRYAFAPVRLEREVPFPDGHLLALGSCGVRAEKTGAAMERYNRAARLGRAALEVWRAGTGRDDRSLAAAMESAPDAADRLRGLLAEPGRVPDATPTELADRLQQFLVESYRVIPAASDAFAELWTGRLGALVDRSQEAAETLLHNQIPETVELAASARALGAAAASAFGAGFGGSVWALVPAAGADAFLASWRAGYLRRFPRHEAAAEFFLTRPGPPATRLA